MIKLLPHSWQFSLPYPAGVSQPRLGLSQTLQFLKKRYQGLNMKYKTLKNFKRRRDARKRNQTTEKGVQALVIGLALVLLLLVGCNGIKHIIEITEPLDHTTGDDGGKLKYKIIFGDKSQKE